VVAISDFLLVRRRRRRHRRRRRRRNLQPVESLIRSFDSCIRSIGHRFWIASQILSLVPSLAREELNLRFYIRAHVALTNIFRIRPAAPGFWTKRFLSCPFVRAENGPLQRFISGTTGCTVCSKITFSRTESVSFYSSFFAYVECYLRPISFLRWYLRDDVVYYLKSTVRISISLSYPKITKKKQRKKISVPRHSENNNWRSHDRENWRSAGEITSFSPDNIYIRDLLREAQLQKVFISRV